MNQKQAFNELMKRNMSLLKQYVPVVSRVHGATHPEFYQVETIFNQLQAKFNASTSHLECEEEFEQLRVITQQYRIPTDVCETYEAVYRMLFELDLAYGAIDNKKEG